MRRLLAILLICFFSASSLLATTVIPLSFEQLVNGSQAVVYGRVTDVRSQWTADRRFIESVVSVEILRGMKGPSTVLRAGSANESIAFTIPGGQVGRYLNVIPGAPTFAAGDLAVFFLTAQGPRLPVTTGLTQGIYRVRRDASSGAMMVVPPAVETAGRIVRGDVKRRPVPLDTFEGAVKAVSVRAVGRLKAVPSGVEGRQAQR
jgi:hypothetical protein